MPVLGEAVVFEEGLGGGEGDGASRATGKHLGDKGSFVVYKG